MNLLIKEKLATNIRRPMPMKKILPLTLFIVATINKEFQPYGKMVQS